MYVYNNEDNNPMPDFDRDGHNPTVYLSEFEARMHDKYGDPQPKEKPADGCWNCMNFDWKHEACTMNWHQLDEIYYNPNCDDRKLTDYCDDWEEDPDADPECIDFGGNEP